MGIMHQKVGGAHVGYGMQRTHAAGIKLFIRICVVLVLLAVRASVGLAHNGCPSGLVGNLVNCGPELGRGGTRITISSQHLLAAG